MFMEVCCLHHPSVTSNKIEGPPSLMRKFSVLSDTPDSPLGVNIRNSPNNEKSMFVGDR